MAKTKRVTSLPDGEEHALAVAREAAAFRVASADSTGEATSKGESASGEARVIPRGADVFTVVVEGASFEALVERDEAEGECWVQVGPERYHFRTGADAASGAHGPRAGGRHELKAPMPGKVVKLLVASGQEVAAGQGVVLFEAMKMQNEIRSPGDGTVAEILVPEGTAVEAKALLLVLQLG